MSPALHYPFDIIYWHYWVIFAIEYQAYVGTHHANRKKKYYNQFIEFVDNMHYFVVINLYTNVSYILILKVSDTRHITILTLTFECHEHKIYF